MKIKVFIENPIHHGAFVTSLKQAERYVARGRARFLDKAPKGFTAAIRFIEDENGEHLLLAHQTKHKLMQRGYDRASGSGIAKRHEMKMLPFAGLTHDNYVRMMSKETVTRNAPNRHGKVKILTRDGQPVESEQAA